jgi:hypothetical protein
MTAAAISKGTGMPVVERFPPKNRTTRTDLGPVDIEIGGHHKVLKFDANRLIIAVLNELLFSELDGPIPAEVKSSILSGRAGYRYCDCDVDMILERDELERFIKYDLTPEEYFKLREHFGKFFMIHDDFYDEETGTAIFRPTGRLTEDEDDSPGAGPG